MATSSAGAGAGGGAEAGGGGGGGGGGLSEQQKQRMDENRRRALALRASRVATPPRAVPAPPRPSLSVRPPSVDSSKHRSLFNAPSTLHPAGTRSAPRQKFAASSNLNRSSGVKNNFYPSDAAKKSSRPERGGRKPSKFADSSSSSTATNSTRESSSILTGACALVSRSCFRVQVAYHSAVVDVFKTIESRQYDSHTKSWSFNLSDYTELLRRLAALGDAVKVAPLCGAVRRAFADQIRGVSAPASTPPADVDLSGVDSPLVDTLMSFQRDGVKFAVARRGRVLIADDMGLGKTLQALCVAALYRTEWPLLIVAPSSVRFTWREQVLRWLPSVDPQQVNVVVKGRDPCASGLVNITSYDLMARQQADLVKQGFKVIIMDESHLLKNGKTARSKAAVPLLRSAKRVILLTGTPALSRPAELYVQISSVDRKMFPNFHEFCLRYCDAQQLPWGWDYSGASNMEELQILLEQSIMIRRLKKDVMKELPEKCRQMVVLDPGSVKVNKGMKACHQLVNEMKGNDRKGALLEYFHETGAAKIPAVKEYVLDLLEADRKLLIFAHHQSVLDGIEDAINKKYQCVRIDGRTSAERRQQAADRFQSSEDVRAAVLSITAASCGLNLTAASVVVFAELFWNPGILMQAEDRAHRIGQKDCVNVQYLVAAGTADDYIWPLVQQKLDVLGKAGLSKDNFKEADTTHFKSSKQRNLLEYFADSFFEEGTGQGTTSSLSDVGPTDQSEPAAAAASELPPGSDWLDDESWDGLHDNEDVPDAEWPSKRPRLHT